VDNSLLSPGKMGLITAENILIDSLSFVKEIRGPMDRALSDIHMHETRKTIRYPMIFGRITEMQLRLRERGI
jgi:hypothetical protein